jgi:TetR/AcrR family transcriptional repressor of nem operon
MRDPEKTRAEILDAAFEEVYHRGFQSSIVNEIVAKTKLTKGAFFHYFPTKNDLGYAIADEILTEMTLDRWIRPLAAYQNPVQGVINRFRKIIESTSEEVMALGCPLNNLTQEMSAVDPVFRDKLHSVLRIWIEGTENYLRKARAEGYLKKDIDPRRLAEFVVMVEEGSFAMVKNLRDRKIFWSLYESLKEYLDSVSTKPEKSLTPITGHSVSHSMGGREPSPTRSSLGAC